MINKEPILVKRSPGLVSGVGHCKNSSPGNWLKWTSLKLDAEHKRLQWINQPWPVIFPIELFICLNILITFCRILFLHYEHSFWTSKCNLVSNVLPA